MPKVLITQEQRAEERSRKMREAIADGLCITRRRSGLSIEALGRTAGVGRNTMSKILAGEDVTLSVNTLLRLLDLAGMSLTGRTVQ